MTNSKRHWFKRPALLSRTRPPTVKPAHASLSSKATRNLIRSHHRLLKARTQASQTGDAALVAKIDAQIQRNGGLESYQIASRLGQSSTRGGDSSKLLVDWLASRLQPLDGKSYKYRLLEVGALSTKNACSMNQSLEVTRIDLNSQEAGILKQDFMERPLPGSEGEQFHIISLSLVLNYVPDAVVRGEMLKRCSSFLTKSPPPGLSQRACPCLFLVLPAACVYNSRYLTESRLQDILSSMGFVLARSKKSHKLIYQLWDYTGDSNPRPFAKELLNPGKVRNNFAIIVQ
ncbi:25S rRNA (adenine2142-N1)-methyltransferase [Aspergillus saccharolyticus JOP 1030-1]|uniref:25S rRNA adenine-N(1) methyltransferase n=1 Tax=Aspergillus saccharolyticus JOP 1030-1 TaxID=1450539 RepID=A0A318Z2S0_9EURO|nr:nucleolus protein [Aspergillus saccharolyticus JOP 1030-1]PYH40674.1 nucleolus protein [Aspergillus saccharolyticus JOP 1030-1]